MQIIKTSKLKEVKNLIFYIGTFFLLRFIWMENHVANALHHQIQQQQQQQQQQKQQQQQQLLQQPNQQRQQLQLQEVKMNFNDNQTSFKHFFSICVIIFLDSVNYYSSLNVF